MKETTHQHCISFFKEYFSQFTGTDHFIIQGERNYRDENVKGVAIQFLVEGNSNPSMRGIIAEEGTRFSAYYTFDRDTRMASIYPDYQIVTWDFCLDTENDSQKEVECPRLFEVLCTVHGKEKTFRSAYLNLNETTAVIRSNMLNLNKFFLANQGLKEDELAIQQRLMEESPVYDMFLNVMADPEYRIKAKQKVKR